MELMNEEDIRQYFISNGGSVRNTDIVNRFRVYLSNPAVRDEARVLFKTYVNKLASVKVENGEKFLVLKRQYFQPTTDVNGNPKQSTYGYGPPSSGGGSTTAMYGSGGNINAQVYNQQPYSAPNNANQLIRRQNSQSQLYGSQFSLSSNYMDPYNNGPANTSQYPAHHNAASSATPANFYPASHYSQPPAPTLSQAHKSPQQQLPLQNISMQQQPIYGSATDFPPEWSSYCSKYSDISPTKICQSTEFIWEQQQWGKGTTPISPSPTRRKIYNFSTNRRITSWNIKT
ncbi:uncharacterized protein LOC118437964 [Folsomia candida]|uniref:Ankyrin repeat domain-containing protein SOWAHB n=1 Tax=Folsomia candida TaxID=158441 RepID=A0A226DL67_FOLCA|nr:uncharacterized protein LOC118437964 [Folsomia candida]OXA44956.1 Ankyrin repeat domain-containing protein SOWAHB [Folsomia candida]